MKLLLKRIFKGPKYTIGKLYIDGVWFCDVIEDKDRGLTQKTPLSDIKRIKVKGETAIPTGTYKITQEVVSPRYSKVSFYVQNCNGGRVPRLLNVPGFDGVLIHAGNTELDSMACLILGLNKVKGKVVQSRETCKKFYSKLKGVKDITITIE